MSSISYTDNSRTPSVRSEAQNTFEGELRRFVNIYVNGEDIRFMDNLATAIKPGDELSIVPAVAGG